MVEVDRVLGQLPAPDRSTRDLLDDPGQLRDRRVGQPVGDRLGARRLEPRVAEVLDPRRLKRLEPLLLLGREMVGRRRVLGRDGARVGDDQRPDDPVAGQDAELLGDPCADVAAVDAVPLVPEPLHDRVERGRSALDAPARRQCWRREAEPGQRRDDDVERVLGATAMGLGVDERADHPGELDERARVAVGHEQRRRARNGRANVDEVDRLAVDVVVNCGNAFRRACWAAQSKSFAQRSARPRAYDVGRPRLQSETTSDGQRVLARRA